MRKYATNITITLRRSHNFLRASLIFSIIIIFFFKPSSVNVFSYVLKNFVSIIKKKKKRTNPDTLYTCVFPILTDYIRYMSYPMKIN